ncbi:hypothetical protein [Maricaulis sp.]|uniref:hypothetical protein n=1 Tax=Maricaulis sp. TaxID=1486257 RepID=UPI0026268559|nr:hypothetical protein [Maricaulis sp.]
MNLLTAQFSATALDQVRRAYSAGTDRPAPRIANMEKRQSARYVADLSRRVSRADMEALNEATQLREQALVFARKAQTRRARGLLDEASALIASRIEDREGQVSAASFHAAAAGFVEHVEAHHEAAKEEMLSALRHCRTLALEFDHSVAMRRVHLARNVARLVWALGDHRGAIALCDQLLDYCWSKDAPWPLGEDTRIDPEPKTDLRRDERVFLTDQLMSEIVSTCADARARSMTLSLDARPIWEGLADRLPERAQAVRRFCAAMPGAELDALLAAASRYLGGGPGDLPMTWRRILRLVENETGETIEQG